MRFKQLDGFIGTKVAFLRGSKFKVGKFKVCSVQKLHLPEIQIIINKKGADNHSAPFYNLKYRD